LTARMYLTTEASYARSGLFQSLRWSRLEVREVQERIVRVERLGLISRMWDRASMAVKKGKL
jgi:hypothetical protein